MHEVLPTESAYVPFPHVAQESEVMEVLCLLCLPGAQPTQVGEATTSA